MKGKLRILGNMGLALFLVSALMVAFMPVAPVQAAATAVEDVWVDFPMSEAPNICSSTANTYIIHFKPHTALSRGIDYVTVTFPDGLSAMGPAAFSTISSVKAADVEFSTNYVTWKRITTDATCGGYRVKAKVPIDIAEETDVWVRFGSTGITAAGTEASTYKVYVATTQDTERVLSTAFALGAAEHIVTATAMETNYPVSPTAGSAAEYIIKFTPHITVPSGGKVTVKFPVGTTLPSATIAATDVSFNVAGAAYTPCGESPTVNINTRELTAKPQGALTQDAICRIKIAVGAGGTGIKNPTRASTDDYYVMVRTSKDGQYDRSAAKYEITATASAKKVLVANGEIGLDATKPYSDDATMLNMYSSQIYITLADEYGNAKYPGSEVTVNLTPGTGGQFFKEASGTGGTGVLSSVTSVTIGAADPETNAQIVYYKSTTPGSCTLKFTDSGGTYTEAEWTFSVCDKVSVIDSSGATIKTYGPTSTTVASETNNTGTVAADYRSKYGKDYITDAIGGAMAGDTVQLGDGTYELDAYIDLNKKVTLTSVNGALKTTLRPTKEDSDTEYAINVTVDGTSTYPVIIDGFTFTRLRSGTEFDCGVWSNSNGDYLTVRNCTFNYIIPDRQVTDEGVIWVRSSSGAITSLTISDNIFTNCATTWPDIDNERQGVIVIRATSGGLAVSGLTISGNKLTDCNGYGIQLIGDGSHLVSGSITDNTFTDCYLGINTSDNMGTVTIIGNTITGAYSYGIKAEGTNNTSITIKKNTITKCAGSYAVNVGDDEGTVTCQYNAIYNNNGYAIQGAKYGSSGQDCKYNWYGDASGPYYSALTGATITKSNPNGTGGKITDAIIYYPWLHTKLTGTTPSVVADNASYQASTLKLVVGWNTLSTPVKLMESADAVDELLPEDSWTIGYWYDAFDEDSDETLWEQITTGKKLEPCDAVYVKMSAVTYALLKLDTKTFNTPNKDLAVGWNLVSLSDLTSTGKDAGDAVASVAKTAAGLPGYSQVVSPSVNANQTDIYGGSGGSWSESYGQDASNKMLPGLGYWIFMQNEMKPGLAGFVITPIPPNFD